MAKDAVIIDTTYKTIDDVVEEIVQYISKGGTCIV
jgi:cytidylate kinase